MCSVDVRDYLGSVPIGMQALEVTVRTDGATTGGVWVEATSKNFRKRISFKLDTKGTGRTVLVAPEGFGVKVRIYATSTFEPLSMMCSTSK